MVVDVHFTANSLLAIAFRIKLLTEPKLLALPILAIRRTIHLIVLNFVALTPNRDLYLSDGVNSS